MHCFYMFVPICITAAPGCAGPEAEAPTQRAVDRLEVPALLASCCSTHFQCLAVEGPLILASGAVYIFDCWAGTSSDRGTVAP